MVPSEGDGPSAGPPAGPPAGPSDGPFTDRQDAGRALAAWFVAAAAHRIAGRPIVLGLPRGGVIVAAPVAAALDAPLDLLAVRKLGLPGEPELAMGAVAALGKSLATVEVERVLRQAHVAPAAFAEVRRAEIRELRRRERAYRAGRPPVAVGARPVILVDDGLATGATLAAAIAVVRREGACSVTVAVPVGAPHSCRALTETVDELICLRSPLAFRAVGQEYLDFAPTSDDEVRAALAPGCSGDR